jgi:hypothetical protein
MTSALCQQEKRNESAGYDGAIVMRVGSNCDKCCVDGRLVPSKVGKTTSLLTRLLGYGARAHQEYEIPQGREGGRGGKLGKCIIELNGCAIALTTEGHRVYGRS